MQMNLLGHTRGGRRLTYSFVFQLRIQDYISSQRAMDTPAWLRLAGVVDLLTKCNKPCQGNCIVQVKNKSFLGISKCVATFLGFCATRVFSMHKTGIRNV